MPIPGTAPLFRDFRPYCTAKLKRLVANITIYIYLNAMEFKRAEGYLRPSGFPKDTPFVCKNRYAANAAGRAGQHYKCKFVATASFIVGPKPDKKADDGHRSIAVYLLDGDLPRFMGTVGVPDRYPLPKVEQIVEVRYLYCHPGPEGKLIQAKYFGKVRDDVALADCSVSQLKVKANDSDPDIS